MECQSQNGRQSDGPGLEAISIFVFVLRFFCTAVLVPIRFFGFGNVAIWVVNFGALIVAVIRIVKEFSGSDNINVNFFYSFFSVALLVSYAVIAAYRFRFE